MGEAKGTFNGVKYAPAKIERPVQDQRYGEVAANADAAINMVLVGLAEVAPNDAAAIAAGAIMALVRFIIIKIVAPLGVPNVRAVFSVLLPAANKAAEQLVELLEKGSPVGQSEQDGSP